MDPRKFKERSLATPTRQRRRLGRPQHLAQQIGEGNVDIDPARRTVSPDTSTLSSWRAVAPSSSGMHERGTTGDMPLRIPITTLAGAFRTARQLATMVDAARPMSVASRIVACARPTNA